MMQLTTALKAWGTPAFEVVLKNTIMQMDVTLLPLQQGLSQSSYTDGKNRSVIILNMAEEPVDVNVKTLI